MAKKLLTKDQEKALMVRMEEGDETARDELITANIRLVYKIAMGYTGRGLDTDDLFQEGVIGLMKAIDRFDYRKGNKLSTYAVHWIHQAIGRAIEDKARTIRVPVNAGQRLSKIIKERRAFVCRHGRKPTPEELAEILGLSVDAVKEIMGIVREPISLQNFIDEEEKIRLGDAVSLQDDDIDDKVMDGQHREGICRILKSLTYREEQVLRKRFGIGERREYTLGEVGQDFDVTRERIRQIEANALEKLRTGKRGRKLRELVGA